MSVAITKEPNWEWPDLLDLNIEITHVKNYQIFELDNNEMIIFIETIEGYQVAFRRLPIIDINGSKDKASKKEELAPVGIESNEQRRNLLEGIE